MKRALLVPLLVLACTMGRGQAKVDSLKGVINNPETPDTTKIKTRNALGWALMFSNPDSSIIVSKQALAIKTDDPKHTGNTLGNLAVYYTIKSDFPAALDYHFKSLKINVQLFQ